MVTNANPGAVPGMKHDPLPVEDDIAAFCPDATHNLSGQRLGRKGQGTRERIMQAMMGRLDGDDPAPITLSAIARDAGVGMSTLYLYFPDMGDLLLAVLRRVIGQMGAPFAVRLGAHWPDETLESSCEVFVQAHFDFWLRYARMLQLRNSLADANDQRLLDYRNEMTRPVLNQLVKQMEPPRGADLTDYVDCAIVLFTGLERTSTIVITPNFDQAAGIASEAERRAYIKRMVRAETNVLHVMMREMRARGAAARDAAKKDPGERA